MGEAAKISLKAIGKQDTHLLSKDPEDSVFKYDIKQYSNFTKLHKSRVVSKPTTDTNWPFGQTVKVEFNPNQMGDLLSDMWIKLRMPSLPTSQKSYADQLSIHLIKSISMYVDGIKLEELTDDWNFIYNELYLNDTQRDANQFLTNDGASYTYYATNSDEGLTRQVLIPLHFFFSRKYDRSDDKHFFPICSIYRQKLTFEIVFHKQSFFTDEPTNITLPEFVIITEEIKLEPEERLYFTSTPRSFEVDVVYKHLQQSSELNKRKIKTNFSTDKPVKIFHWFFRLSELEDENDASLFKKRFNFTSNSANFRRVNGDDFEIAERFDIYLNGEDVQHVSGDANHRYFKYYTPYEGILNTPITHIYTYNVSLYPSKQVRSGILDFSKIISDKSFIQTELHKFLDLSKTYEMHVYDIAYTRLEFRDGYINIVY
jgi:hypothetical protein